MKKINICIMLVFFCFPSFVMATDRDTFLKDTMNQGEQVTKKNMVLTDIYKSFPVLEKNIRFKEKVVDNTDYKRNFRTDIIYPQFLGDRVILQNTYFVDITQAKIGDIQVGENPIRAFFIKTIGKKKFKNFLQKGLIYEWGFEKKNDSRENFTSHIVIKRLVNTDTEKRMVVDIPLYNTKGKIGNRFEGAYEDMGVKNIKIAYPIASVLPHNLYFYKNGSLLQATKKYFKFEKIKYVDICDNVTGFVSCKETKNGKLKYFYAIIPYVQYEVTFKKGNNTLQLEYDIITNS